METIMQFYDHAGLAALGSRLRRLADMITRDSEAIYKLYDVSLDPRWFPVFYMLSVKKEAAITELAKDIGQSHPSVSQVVREMTKAGLATTTKSPEDSRITLVVLSEAGQALLPKLTPQIDDVDQAVAALLAKAGVNFWQDIEAVEDELAQDSLLTRVRALRKEREGKTITLIDYTQDYQEAFQQLNLEWIKDHWEPEEADLKVLRDPQKTILDPGGCLLLALQGPHLQGACALLKMEDKSYELAKMAVFKHARGKGIGLLLGRAILEKAKQKGAKRVYLESNTALQPALHLYRKLGFRQIANRPSPYNRCNVQMELFLEHFARL